MPDLHRYQVVGAEWLSKKTHAILADQMGLGKSAQLIRAADLVDAKTILVICRAVARLNWKNEFEIFAQHQRKISVVGGVDEIPERIERAHVVICSFEGLAHFIDRFGNGLSLDLVVVDESHFVKSVNAARSKNVFGAKGVIRKTKRLWCATGTPTPNNASEIWLPLFVFGATRLSQEAFTDKFCTTLDIGFGKQVTGTKTDPSSVKAFNEILSKCVLKRDFSDSGLNLPPVYFEDVVVAKGSVDVEHHFPGQDRSELKAELEESYGLLNSILDNGKMSDDLLEIIKGQASSLATLRRFTGLQKVAPVIDLIEGELLCDPKLKIIIFAIHRGCIQELKEGLIDFDPVVIQGGSNQNTVTEGIKDFQDPNGLSRLVIGQIEAAGTSITLTASHEVVLLERAWSVASNAQAIHRALRIGQKWPVRVRNIVIDDPIERRISHLIQEKTESLAKLYLKELSNV